MTPPAIPPIAPEDNPSDPLEGTVEVEIGAPVLVLDVVIGAVLVEITADEEIEVESARAVDGITRLFLEG